MVYRLYAEKKPGFDIEAQGLLSEIRQNLGVTAADSVRIMRRYDIEGLDQEQFDMSKNIVFSEPNADNVYLEDMPETSGVVFATAYLPGQYDQCADSAAQCVQLITCKERPRIKCANVYVIGGELSDADVDTIKGYLINPVESSEVTLEKPETLDEVMPVAPDVPVIEGFISLDDDAIDAMVKERGMAMTKADLICVRDYFASVKRDPTETELKVIDTYWSDHCRHTTFLSELTDVSFGKEAAAVEKAFADYLAARKEINRVKPVTLMDIATIAPKLLTKWGMADDLDVSDEINACSINVTANIDGVEVPYLIMFKNETHNHPTEIEPFGGAATCLGGAIRDPLSGRSYVYQAMRITGCADVRKPHSETLEGKLSQRKISTGAAAGYSSYGNQIGLATGIVKEIYHDGYVAKHMELGAVIGAAPKENVRREKPQDGDLVILVGGATGRDGCGGATGSSKAHDLKSLETCGAEVQKGNPPTERALQRLFRNKEAAQLIKRCNDFGAGGVCVAIGELADGLLINLDAVPKKYDGLTGTELAISESQERMAVVVGAEDAEKFLALADQENLNGVIVARVTEEPRLVMKFRGGTIVDLERSFLDTNGAAQFAKAHVEKADAGNYFSERNISWLDNLSQLNVCSQRGLVERFDSSIGASSVLYPYGGKFSATETQAMCAKIPVPGETRTCTLMAHGFSPDLSYQSPFHGAVYAVLESVAKIVAAGGNAEKARLTLQEFFEKLGTDPKRWGKPLSALLGAFHAQRELGLPAIGGKDSMSGSFGDLDVPPTLVSFAVSAQDIGDIITPELKAAGHKLAVLKISRDENMLPDLKAAMAGFKTLNGEIKKGNVISAYVVGEGGYAAAISKMAFGNRIGVNVFDGVNLFTPYIGDIIVECRNVPFGFTAIGDTISEKMIIAGGNTVSIEEAYSAWENTLTKVFPSKVGEEGKYPEVTNNGSTRNTARPVIKTAKPRVFIPVYPGTNCEYDTARAFNLAGGEADVFVIRNRTAAQIAESIEEMVRRINNSQILMLPGGFSGGDEPDGSGKFIAATLKNPQVAEAVMNLLYKRDGLALGICNGFQALIKTGLVPYGEIRETAPTAPTLTFNTVGRHAARVVSTKITSVKSPWFAGVEEGDIHTIAISHGEGRFVGTDEEIRALFANGQVATQYVNFEGEPVKEMPFNPNGSMYAIEGITSPDGRVLGKMGHSERMGDHVGINAPGNTDQKLFESGVNYFK